MHFRAAADGVLVLHLAFIVFALLGGRLAFKWRWMPVIHIPAVAWAFFVELTSGACPLTAIENHLRLSAGQSGYAGSFIEHYLLAVIYPAGLTPGIQAVLAAVVLGVNLYIYSWLALRQRSRLKKTRFLESGCLRP